ncbi:MAG: PhzF family phenazine biosynthesis protein [Rhodospirillales bacterium]|nr:PhzF family phenazine biosynthesis protein [Rhodospirillales bacterium]
MKFWQVDAFTKEPFKGNPAAVFVLEDALTDSLMQNIAIEMNLSETAFILLRKGQTPLLRWFTPTFEIDLCGHATLASAHTYLSEVFPGTDRVTFSTRWVGDLTVERIGDAYRMDFPVREGKKLGIEEVPDFVLEGLSEDRPVEAYKARDLMLVYENVDAVRKMQPDFNKLAAYKDFIIVTASNGDKYDFISRFFCADDGIAEDPVTGSAHCTLAPYWAGRLGKKAMTAYQASQRGGILKLDLKDDRLFITGDAVTVFSGEMSTHVYG